MPPSGARDKVNPLVIAVGSLRRPKLEAVRAAMDDIAELLARDRPVEIVGVEVASGVTHTPASREELMRGARQRAEALRAISERTRARWDYFVGLEGGLDRVPESGQTRVFLESWAYASDGVQGHFGRSGGVELPPELAEEVLARGTELSVAIDRFAGAEGIRDAQGAWGILSGDKISRREAFRVAVIAAFAPFYNRPMYRRTAGAG
jgi:inosine/xanthosine triphosphatase